MGEPETSYPETQDPDTLYEAVGGMPFFERLVDEFYRGVADDDVLLPLFPSGPICRALDID